MAGYDDGLVETRGVSLSEVGSEPMTLTIEGTEYTLRPLELGDYAATQQYIRANKLNALLAVLANKSEELQAKALAELASKPMTMIDLWKETDGETFMLHRALFKHAPKMTVSYVLNKLPAIDRRIMNKILMYVCGIAPLVVSDEVEAESPSPKACPSNGTPNSATSAATSK